MTALAHHYRGVFYALAGFTVWVFSDTCLKFITGSVLPKYEIMAFMSVSALITVAAIVILQGKTNNLRVRKPSRMFILGFFLASNNFALLLAFRHLSIVGVYAITFVGPMLTAILASIFLREQVNLRQALALVTGFCGVIIAINPFRSFDAPGDWIGYAAAFVSLALNTANMLYLRFYGEKEHAESMSFYPRIIMMLVCFVPCVVGSYEPVTTAHVVPLVAAGFFAGIGWLLMTVACQKSPASVVAPFRYSQIVTAAIVGYVIWHDVPAWHVWAGVAVIVAAGLWGTPRVMDAQGAKA